MCAHLTMERLQSITQSYLISTFLNTWQPTLLKTQERKEDEDAEEPLQ